MSSPDRANVILIVADTLRADHLGLYGYSRPTSTFLDQLASRAVVFDNAYSHYSYTWPTVANLFTGIPYSRLVHDGLFVPPSESNERTMQGDLETLAERLAIVGVRPVGVSANPYVTARTGVAQGFETFHDVYAWDPDFWKGAIHKYRVEEVNEVVLDLVEHARETRPRRPFFLYAHYFDSHMPYTAPAEDRALFEDPGYSRTGRVVDGYLRDPDGEYLSYLDRADEAWLQPADIRHLEAQYDAEIHHFDRGLRALFEELERRGVLESTTVIITADHGEAFFEHRCWGHGRTSMEEEEHVPLMVVPPWHTSTTPRRVSAPVTTSDLYYSILGHFDAVVASDGSDGAMPWQRDIFNPDPGSPVVLSEGPGDATILRDGRVSYYRYASISERLGKHFPDSTPPVQDGEYLFNLERDPGETDNLFERDPVSAQEVRDGLWAECSGCPTVQEEISDPMLGGDAETRRRLRALGYVE